MGNGACQGEKYDKEAAQINREIENRLLKERRQGEEYKLLLLGTGESGKSTIAKQMKIIHLSGFTKEEKVGFRSIVYNNVVKGAQSLILAARKRNLSFQSPEEVEMIEALPPSINHYPVELAKAITNLWKDPNIQIAYNESQLSDSTNYFMLNAERFSDPEYVPTELDILKVRVKTTGITETVFYNGKNRFRMVDVGGQRNERKKWIHCFQEVTAIIFCVASNEYDMVLEEDSTVNRMHESLKLFGDIINNEWFWNTKIILFLNKEDLFIEKIKKIDLSICFPNYDGGLSFDNASKYIEKKFKERNKNNNRPINSKYTCATDTSNIRYVFNMLESFLFEEVMKELPF